MARIKLTQTKKYEGGSSSSNADGESKRKSIGSSSGDVSSGKKAKRAKKKAAESRKISASERKRLYMQCATELEQTKVSLVKLNQH